MGTQDYIFNKIKNDFQLLTKVVLNQLSLCHTLLSAKKDDKEIVANEGIIDSIEVKLRSEVINAIVLHTPRAIELRKIIAYYDMTANLERVGDHLLNITTQLNGMNHEGPVMKKCVGLLEKLYKIVEVMTQNAIFAFACEDNLLAKKTILEDDKADLINKQIMDTVAEMGTEGSLTKEDINDILLMGALAYNLERIGDSATNIAESAIYLTEGRYVLHHDTEENK